MTTPKTSPKIYWTDIEFSLFFKRIQLKEEQLGGHVKGADIDQLTALMLIFPSSRRKWLSKSAAYHLLRQYRAWCENSDPKHWRYVTQKADQPAVPPVAEEPQEWSLHVAEPASSTEEISSSVVEMLTDTTLEQPVEEVLKTPVQPVEDAIAQAEVEPPVVEESTTQHPAETSEVTAAPVAAEPTNPLAEAIRLMFRDLGEMVVERILPLVRPESTSVEKDLRAIVRDEIEVLLGGPTTAPAPQPVEDQALTPEEPVVHCAPLEVYVPYKAPPKVVVEEVIEVIPPKTTFKVLVFGLKEVQLTSLSLQLPPCVTIEGTDSLANALDLAKHADYVVVSRFATHGIYYSLRNRYEDKTTFASGGTSMIKRMICEFVDKQLAANVT